MTVVATSGTILAISLAKPATLDAAGFAALTYTRVGEITDFGAITRQWQTVEHKPVESRMTKKTKGGYNPGQQTFNFGKDFSDAGQIAVRNAWASPNEVSIKVSFSNDVVMYYTCLVTKEEMNPGGVDSNVNGSFDVEITSDPVFVDA
jgi:hypothetical protein